MKYYKTLKPIEALGVIIPPDTTVSLKFQSKDDTEIGWFEFLGIYSGLTKVIKMSEVEIVDEMQP